MECDCTVESAIWQRGDSKAPCCRGDFSWITAGTQHQHATSVADIREERQEKGGESLGWQGGEAVHVTPFVDTGNKRLEACGASNVLKVAICQEGSLNRKINNQSRERWIRSILK